MGSDLTVAWWQRLLFGFGASVFTLFLLIAIVVARDFWQDPTLQWGNAGEFQIAAYIFILAGLGFLITSILFVVPLVLIWPADSQQKHWYAVLCVTMLWPPILMVLIERHHPSMFFHELRSNVVMYGGLELIALFACGCYLLSIRWQYSRRVRNSIQQKLDPAPQDEL
jgi:hypothetical protein